MKVLPNLLCIGAQRSGSTWLYKNLATHPHIWLTPIKELHHFDRRGDASFFDRLYRRQLRQRVRANIRALYRKEWSLNEFLWDINFFCHRRSDDWYASLFSQASGHIAGEVTPAYSTLSAETVAEIQRFNPNLKIIFLMRDPIDRSWSQARKDLPRVYGKRLQDIPEHKIVEWFHSKWCSLRSDYVRTMDNWTRSFPSEQIFFGFFEEIESSPANLLSRIFRFLEVEDSSVHMSRSIHEPVNSRTPIDIPPTLEYELAQISASNLEILEKQFGEFPRRWNQRCSDILNSKAIKLNPGTNYNNDRTGYQPTLPVAAR